MGIDGERLKKLHLSRGLSPGKDSDPVADPKGYYNDPDVADRVEALQEILIVIAGGIECLEYKYGGKNR